MYIVSTTTIIEEYSRVYHSSQSLVSSNDRLSEIENVHRIIGIKFAHSEFLESWIALPTHTTLVAVNDQHRINIGVGVIRETTKPTRTGYRLGPLLADSGDIARGLLLALAKKVGPGEKFVLVAPVEINPDAEKMVAELKKDSLKACVLVRMYTLAEPPITSAKYFSVFSGNIVG